MIYLDAVMKDVLGPVAVVQWILLITAAGVLTHCFTRERR